MKKLLVFGAAELQHSLIKCVQHLGLWAIAIDPDPQATGLAIADEFAVVDPDDYHSTLQLANQNSIAGVVTAATDNPIIMMARVAASLGLRSPSVESVSSVLDKARFKEILEENALPCARGFCLGRGESFDMSKIIYPVIVKPNKGSGSRGVIICNNDTELLGATKKTLQFCRDDRYIVEEYIPGDEISVEAWIYQRKLEIVQITDKILGPPPYNVEYGHIQPSKYSRLKNQIQDLLQQVIEAVGLDNCALHPELKVNDRGLFIIEIGPRLGGDYITSHLVPLSTGTNMEQAVINIALGSQPHFSAGNMCSMISYLSLPEGTVVTKDFSRAELLKTHPNVKHCEIRLAKGDRVKTITNSASRYGFWITAGTERERMIADSEAFHRDLLDTLGLEFGKEHHEYQ